MTYQTIKCNIKIIKSFKFCIVLKSSIIFIIISRIIIIIIIIEISITIDILAKIKKSKGFRGLEKNKLLAYIVKHLEIDKTLKELKKQKSKEKIVNHIREKSLNM